MPGSGVDPADLKFYFAARDHDLVRSVEAALTHEGLPARYYTEPARYVRDNFAEHGLDAEADAAAEEYTGKYAEEMGLQRAQEVTREVIEDLENDERESVVAVDRDTGEIIFVRYGDDVSVTLQEEQRKLTEGRNIVLIHNHPGNGAASLADLGAADWLDAERLVVVTPSGKRYYYHRRGGKLEALKPVQGSGAVAESDPVETAVARLLHMMQSAREAGNPAERVMWQDHPAVIANSDVNVDEIPRYDELARFVTSDLETLLNLAMANPEIIREHMALLEDIFGYNVEFKQTYSPASAIEQVYNLASSHYHVVNTFGIEVLLSSADETNYYLGADAVIPGDQPEHRGYVPLPQSSSVGLENAYIGSEMTVGGITHETFHEIDRRFDGRLSIPYYFNPETGIATGVGGLEWFLSTKVTNRITGKPFGFKFGMMIDEESDQLHLNEDSRASDDEDNSEIFPDVAAAVVLGPLEENFFSKADEDDPENRIGFARNNSNVRDLICGVHQYVKQIASGVREPDDFKYNPDECI